jgi:hypothetical protein
MVEDWINKKNLSKMGFSFDPSTLTDFEVSCYSIIASKFAELEIADMKKGGKNE